MQRATLRADQILERILLAAIALAWTVLLLVAFDILPRIRGLGFVLAPVIVIGSNAFWWSWVRRWIAGSGVRRGTGARARLLLSLAWTAYCLLMISPFFLILIRGRREIDALPVPLLAWILIWHLLLVGLGAMSAVALSIRGLARWGRAWRARLGSAGDCRPQNRGAEAAVPRMTTATNEPLPENTEGLSRRALLAGMTAAAPLVLAGAGTLTGRRQEGRFLVREVTMAVPRLPERLRGLTITHVSDIHLGRFFRPEHLPRLVDAANQFRGDIIAVTGDIIDHSNDFLPAVQAAIAQITAPFGRYIVTGNHDLVDEPNEFRRYLTQREPHFLRDALVRVDIGGEQIQVAGLDWAPREGPTLGEHGLAWRAGKALSGGQPGLFTIALSHHPHAFDPLAAKGADLVLAGHTHGGQFMLTPPGMRPPLGLGNFFFRYLHGVYELGHARMYVNAGVGNWFPVRVNAPAEIVKIRLI
jgi:predicted MPP superfamily phosphohydrolase